MSDGPAAAGSGKPFAQSIAPPGGEGLSIMATTIPMKREEAEEKEELVQGGSNSSPPSTTTTTTITTSEVFHATILDVLAVAASLGHARDLDRCSGLDRSTWHDTQLFDALSRVEYEGKRDSIRTRIEYNIKHYQPARVKWLLARGADPNRHLQNAASTYVSAREDAQKEAFRETGLLLARHPRTDPGKALVIAAELEDVALIHQLVGKGADVLSKRPGWLWSHWVLTPLQHASHRHNLEAIRALFSEGAVVGEGGADSALGIALKASLKVDSYTYTWRDVGKCTAAVMELALHPSCPPTDALFAAAVCGRHDLFPSLIDTGAKTTPPSFTVEVHVFNFSRYTDYCSPLMASCIHGNIDTFSALREFGATFGRGEDRMRAFSAAGRSGNVDLITAVMNMARERIFEARAEVWALRDEIAKAGGKRNWDRPDEDSTDEDRGSEDGDCNDESNDEDTGSGEVGGDNGYASSSDLCEELVLRERTLRQAVEKVEDGFDELGRTILNHACKAGSLEAVLTILRLIRSVHPWFRLHGEPILICACESGSLELVTYLLEEEGCDAEATIYGSESEDFVPHLLMADGMSIEGFTALMVASWFNFAHLIPILVEHGADIEARSWKFGSRAITLPQHDYADPNNIADFITIQALLQAGAELHLESSAGRSVLYRVCEVGSVEFLRSLLERERTVGGWRERGTPYDHRFLAVALHSAVCYNRVDMARMLLDSGADVNWWDHFWDWSDGWVFPLAQAAIQCAVGDDSMEVLKMILAAGADPTMKCREGFTALQHAQKRKERHPGVEALLEEAGRTWREAKQEEKQDEKQEEKQEEKEKKEGTGSNAAAEAGK